MGDIEDAKKWINERLVYISQNCDLKEADNKRAVESLKTALNCIEEVEKKEKKVNDNSRSMEI